MACWTVQASDQRQALRRWQSGLARAFVRLDAEAAGAADVFAGRIDQVRVGTLRVSGVSAHAHRVVRRREHIGCSGEAIVFANLQIAGRGATTLGRSTWEAAPLDLTIVPTCETYAIENRHSFELLSFAVPAASLPEGLVPGRLSLSVSPVGREVAGTLASLAQVARALPSGLASQAERALEAQIVGALGLAAAVGGLILPNDAQVDPAHLRVAILAHIARRFADPSLSAAPIAAAFGLSGRRLHALFEGTDTSVGKRIRALRLAAAGRLLAETSLPISVVAARTGFADLGYFTRVFRRAHGMSPRDWRAARSS